MHLPPRHVSAPPLASRLVAAAVLLLFALNSPSVAVAQALSAGDKERAEAIAIEAKVFFKSGLYADAASGFMRAYAISKRPDMMFNAARAYEEARLHAQSIALFDQYLKLDDAPEDGKREAVERIARQRALLGSAAPAPAPAPPAPTPASATAEPAPIAPAPAPAPAPALAPALATPPVATVSAPADPPARWLSYTLIGVGVFFEFAGISGIIRAREVVTTANDNTEAFKLVDADKTYRQLVKTSEGERNAGVFLVVAGAGLGAWGGWRLWTRAQIEAKTPAKATASSPRATVRAHVVDPTWAPLVDPVHGTLGMALGGRF